MRRIWGTTNVLRAFLCEIGACQEESKSPISEALRPFWGNMYAQTHSMAWVSVISHHSAYSERQQMV